MYFNRSVVMKIIRSIFNLLCDLDNSKEEKNWTKMSHINVILPVSAKKSSTYLFMSAALSGYRLGAYGATLSLGSGLTPSVLLTFVMFAVAWPAEGPLPPPWPTLIFGRPTMLEPTLPRGDTECTLGCTSVVPVPDIAPTGLFICNEDVFAVF